MRVVHLSDTHLGFRQLHRVDEAGRNVREQDVARAFTEAIERAIALAPDAVIHAGDLFDSHHPSAAALGVALDGLARLRAAGIPIILIAGNHETPRAMASEHIFSVLERFGEGVHAIHAGPETVRVGDGLAIHGIPYDNDLARMTEAIRVARPDPGAEASVLVAHVGLTGLGGVVGPEASLAISGEALAGSHEFAYVALGHLHKFSAVADNAAYAGSTERLSWADDAPVKGLVEVDLARDPSDRGYLRRHAVHARPYVELEPIDATGVEDLTAAIVARAHEDPDALRGAIVRLWVRNVTSAQWNAVDHQAIAAAYAECLHFERRAEPRGAMADARAADAVAVPALREFLLRWPGARARGVDPEDFVARAEGFVALADEELAT
jgi:DNA repair protein SbcD/Mre11